MKFKGQGKSNICGFEYKKNIADSRRGVSEHQKKPLYLRLGGGGRLPQNRPPGNPDIGEQVRGVLY